VILSGQLPTQALELVCITLLYFVFIPANQKQPDGNEASRAFLPPEVTLENKFRQPVAKGYIPAQRTTPKQKRNVT